VRVARAPRLPAAARPPWLLEWRAALAQRDATTGQVGTFTRTTTQTAPDVHGTNYTAPHSLPAWAMVDTDADTVRDRLGLLMDANGAMSWACEVVPQALTVYVSFEMREAIANAKAILSLGGDGTGARLAILSTGSFYQVLHHNGSSSVSATLGAAPSLNQRVELRAVLRATGSVLLGQAINGAAETVTGASGTLALAAAWGAAVFRLARDGAGAVGAGLFFTARIAAGELTLEQIRERV
jgi:hypothetical protein